MEANHALFLFDSCFSGTVFKAKALPETPPHISAMTARPVRQFIAAGDAGEEVPAKSVFAQCFVRGLEGEADLSEDGYVTGSELGLYLREKVMYYKTGQTPQYGKIRDPDLDEGDFVFALSGVNLPDQGIPIEVVFSPSLDRGVVAWFARYWGWVVAGVAFVGVLFVYLVHRVDSYSRKRTHASAPARGAARAHDTDVKRSPHVVQNAGRDAHYTDQSIHVGDDRA